MTAATTLRIGSHPMNFSLFILRRRNVLEPLAQARGWQVQWLDYAEGRHSGDYLARNELDWVGTGSTPPLYSQANGVDLAYVAASASRATGSALLVRHDSDLHSLAQLEDARIAATAGSYTDHFIAQALHDNQLSYRDVQVLDLPGRAGEQALVEGQVDAWAALEPLLSQRLAAGDVRVLGAVGDFIPNRSLYWARREWLRQAPEQARLVYAALADNDRWIAEHLQQAAQIMADAHDSAVDAAGWATTLAQRPWGIQPADSTIVGEQQRQARLLYDVGLLAAPLDGITGIDLSSPGAHS
ncbi:ABC transporter substrate-binding protein [Pseudomonas putida]